MEAVIKTLPWKRLERILIYNCLIFSQWVSEIIQALGTHDIAFVILGMVSPYSAKEFTTTSALNLHQKRLLKSLNVNKDALD